MGALVNRRPTTVVATICAAVVLCLNMLLVYESAYNLGGGSLPGIPGIN